MDQAPRRAPGLGGGGTSAERWEEAAGAAGVGTFDWDLRTGELAWNDALLSLFGLTAQTFGGTIEAFNALVHPDDVARVTAALREAVDTCGLYEAEYRVHRPDGQVRWLHARGRALCDEQGLAVRLAGAALDSTAVHESESRVAHVLESMSAAFYALDASWRFTYVNAEAERLLGRRREELLGGVLWELFPAAVGSVFEHQYRLAAATGEASRFEAYYPAPLDGWYELRVWPAPGGLSVYFLDITEQRAALGRVDLLARVTTELTETFDVEEAVARLARLVVPELADLCLVSLVSDDQVDWRRRLRDVAWTAADPELQPLLDVYAPARVAAFTDDSPLAEVLHTGEPVVLDDAAGKLAAALRPGTARDALRGLAPRSAVLLPVRARGRTRGVLTLWWREHDRVRPDDLQTAVDIAARAGLALDNARLYERQRELSEALQRALLTEPPEPDHLQIVVRYLPATEAARVGGDWYDAFQQPDGATTLVIGDVVGHDATAAAAMGQLRGLLRGIAATTGEGPAEVLSRLDAAMEVLRMDTTATVVLARLEQTPEEVEQGVTRLRWSSAGHPPPVVVDPGGAVRVLAGDDADLLLGIDPATPRRERVEVLDRGSTVLLFTDGLLERRGRGLDEGLAELQAELTALAGLDLDDLCDALLERMLAGGREDDVALTAVRLHRQDRPGPDAALREGAAYCRPMSDLHFWFDPVCPFAWMTSTWVRQVASQRSYDVVWRPISLRLVNGAVDYDAHFPAGYEAGHTAGLRLLRVCARAGQEHGADAVGRLYAELGARTWEVAGGMDGLPDRLPALLAEALPAAGLPEELAGALEDGDAWDAHLQAETDAALSLVGKDVGTPVLHVEPPHGVAFFGPVISRRPTDAQAVELWDHVVGLARFAGFAEIKRSLRERPQLPAWGWVPGAEGEQEDWHGGSRRQKQDRG